MLPLSAPLRRVLAVLALVAAVACTASAPEAPPMPSPELQQYRNLGKAFYENPGSQNEAIEALGKALELNPGSAREHLNYGLALLRAGRGDEGIAHLEKAKEIDPGLPHPYFNLGIEFKNRGETERAIAELEKMAELVPDEAKAHYNLGQLYRQQGRTEEAIARFERAAELDPSLAAPHFQLYNIFRRTGRERARRELEIFQRLKAAQEDAAVPEDVDWSFYSELYDPAPPAPPSEWAGDYQFVAEEPIPAVAGQPRGLFVWDFNADGSPDLFAWSADSATVVANQEGRLQPLEASRAGSWKGLRHAAAGDFDNNGFPDLALVFAGRVALAANQGGSFPQPLRELARGDFEFALWVDFDHDYDLDLLAVGHDQALLRNNGDGAFEDVSADFPFESGKKAWGAAALELEEDGGSDIVIAWQDAVRLYEDRKLGRYEPHPAEGASGSSGPVAMTVIDYDHDGFLDVALTDADGASTVLLRNDRGTLRAAETIAGRAVFADLANRGRTEAITAEQVLAATADGYAAAGAQGNPTGWTRAAAADFDGGGRIGVFSIGAGGIGQLYRNETETGNRHVTVALEGVKSNKLAEGARVEVKAGVLYTKRLYGGYPLTFGVGPAETIDTVRITWPNGLIQNEWRQPAGQTLRVEEKPRLSGSCPMIFTWNGREFEFLSEVLGVAPLGAGLGGGEFFPTDHDEFVWIAGEQLAPKDGFYEVRITEELREVGYIDQVKLLAADHPAGIELYTSEKFKAPPFPEFELYGVRERIRPAAARTASGDVLERVLRRDRRYAGSFARDFRGRAERHTLTLDFPALEGRDDAFLFLHGWVDWADASTIVAASQGRQGFVMPYLQVRDANGQWVTAIEDVGLPGGRPRTIAVDLSGKFLSASREIRIVTNLCVYWDEVFAATAVTAPTVDVSEQTPVEARLRFRGFSAAVIHPERKQPEAFAYERVFPTAMWNPTPGLYTRYGPVEELVAEIDDRFVIFGAGDELVLRFAAGLPPPKPGWRRDFLLFVDGWAKENEANTAFGGSVEPLPFHRMSAYPYPGKERYPESQAHRKYLQEYIQRPAVRLIGSLTTP